MDDKTLSAIRQLRSLGAVAIKLGDVEVAFAGPEVDHTSSPSLPSQGDEELSEEEAQQQWEDLALWSSQ